MNESGRVAFEQESLRRSELLLGKLTKKKREALMTAAQVMFDAGRDLHPHPDHL